MGVFREKRRDLSQYEESVKGHQQAGTTCDYLKN